MWVVEGRFRNLEGNSTTASEEFSERKRWLRPSRVYSLGRESLNDFSLELPRTLSRTRGLELDAGSWNSNAQDSSSETSKPSYPLTITNHDSKARLLYRGGGTEQAIPIASTTSVNIEPGDEIADASMRFVKFSWNPINICYSALGAAKRAQLCSELKDAGFSCNEARFPSKENTHFLPKPLKPTLPIGYALMEGIQLISESWLDELLGMTRLKPNASRTSVPKRKENESDQEYEQRVQLRNLLQSSRSKGFSEFEVDYETAWKKLLAPNLTLPQTTANPDFKRWLQHPIKLNPNPKRKHLFSNVNVILLANENDENSKNLQQILQAGQATVSTICTTGDDDPKSIEQQLQNLLSQSKSYFILKTPLFTGSLTNIKGQTIKTVNELLNAIYEADISDLVTLSSGGNNPPSTDTLTKDLHRSEDGTSTPHEIKAPSTSVNREKGSNTEHASPTSKDEFSTQASRPKLLRRADTRSDAARMQELERLMGGPDISETVGSELETMKMYAKMEDPSMDQSTILLNKAEFSNPTPAPNTKEIDKEQVSNLTPELPSRSPSPPIVTQRPLLKRKVRDRDENDINKYMPFLAEDVNEAPVRVEPETVPLQNDSSSTHSTKRQRLDDSSHYSQSASVVPPKRDLNVDKIEGPVTKMLKAAAEQTQKELKRKASGNLSVEEGDEPSEDIGKQQRRSKRGRTNEQSVPDKKHTQGTGQNDLEPGGKTKSRSSKEEVKNGDEDSASLYLTVKTTGKRLTAEEVESNIEFNRLQISKTPALLKHKTIPTRPIGWDEEDQSENELREMDSWGNNTHTASKSFFKVKYVNLVKKHSSSNYLQSTPPPNGSQSAQNFKKFKPKNCGIDQFSTTSAQRKNKIKMETVQLNETIRDREPSKTQGGTSSKTQTGFESSEGEELESQEKLRNKATKKPISKKSTKKQGHNYSSDISLLSSSNNNNNNNDEDEDEDEFQGKKSTQRKRKDKQDDDLFFDSDSQQGDTTTHLSTKKLSNTTNKKKSSASTTNQTQRKTQQTNITRNKSSASSKKKKKDQSSESDDDELAFKGFGKKK